MVETLITLVLFILTKKVLIFIITRFTSIKNKKIINFLIDLIVTIL